MKKSPLRNLIFRTFSFNVLAALLALALGFLTIEITDTSTNPATIELEKILTSVWLYVSLALVVANIFLNVLIQRDFDALDQYTDHSYLEAKLIKAALEEFSDRMPEMIANGTVKTLDDVRSLVRAKSENTSD